MSIDRPMRPLLLEAKQVLDSFLSASAQFRVVKTVSQSSSKPPKTLFILDSSYNPPSKAHLKLATSALASSSAKYPLPHRLLILFSVHNADKAPGPAAFDQRLAMMILFAQDLSKILATATSVQPGTQVPIDVGLTSNMYYNDKSTAIEKSGTYSSTPRHIHLVGFDTFARIFTPKYYKDHDPPLSALGPYFQNHGFRVKIRPGEHWGDENQQHDFLKQLRNGSLDREGAKKEWANEVDLFEAADETDVSSTKARKAAETQDWEQLNMLCTSSVSTWVKEEGLYLDNDTIRSSG